MQVVVGYTVRDFCDGQSLASPGRWPPSKRCPQSDGWKAVVTLVKRFSDVFCSAKLLMELALGRVKERPFPNEAVSELKNEIVKVLSSRGHQLRRENDDRNELPIDFRFLSLLLRVTQDPDTKLGTFVRGVKVGPGTRMPRHPALYRPKRKWRLDSQRDPTSWQLEEEHQSEHPWRQNYASLVGFADKVEAVLEDQAGRGQVLKFMEAEARARFPDLVVASLGANLHPRDSVRAVPPFVSFFLRHLAEQISECRHHDCSTKMYPDQLAPRMLWLRSGFRSRSPKLSGCGSLRGALNRHSSSLRWKLLAVLVALKVGETPRSNRSRIRIDDHTTEGTERPSTS